MGGLDGKVAFVTGGTSGIGRAIATGLARQGASVALLARSRDRGAATAAAIRGAVPAAKVEIFEGDLASLDSVRAAVGSFLSVHPSLHILACSAGVFHRARAETTDGLERTFQVNYLSHFLIANLLAEALKRGAPSRVVFVASRYGNTKIEFDDLNVVRRKFTIMTSVPQTKLAEVLLAQELAERWKGTGISVNAVHPGLVKHTNLLNEVGGFPKLLVTLFGRPPEKGAETALWLLTAPENAGVSGQMWAKRRPIPTPGQGSDPASRARLWSESVRLARLG